MPGRPVYRSVVSRIASLASERGAESPETYWFGRIAQGETVRALCRDLACTPQLFYTWVNATDERRHAFQAARRLAAHSLAEETLEIADTATPETVQRAREQIGVRKWLAAIYNPTEFSERAGSPEGVTINIQQLHLEALKAAPAEALMRAEVAALPPAEVVEDTPA